MSLHLKVHMNASDGVQVEWRGILFTMRQNPAHGLYGSIAVQEGKRTLLLEFHGDHPEAPLPFKFHETEMKQPR